MAVSFLVNSITWMSDKLTMTRSETLGKCPRAWQPPRGKTQALSLLLRVRRVSILGVAAAPVSIRRWRLGILKEMTASWRAAVSHESANVCSERSRSASASDLFLKKIGSQLSAEAGCGSQHRPACQPRGPGQPSGKGLLKDERPRSDCAFPLVQLFSYLRQFPA